MIEKNEIANVWFIENNKLYNRNRVVSKVIYDGVEIAIVKSKRDWVYPNLLVKDKENNYWEFGTLPIRFDKFITASVDKTIPDVKEYCDSVIKVYQNLEKHLKTK